MSARFTITLLGALSPSDQEEAQKLVEEFAWELTKQFPNSSGVKVDPHRPDYVKEKLKRAITAMAAGDTKAALAILEES